MKINGEYHAANKKQTIKTYEIAMLPTAQIRMTKQGYTMSQIKNNN